MDYIKREDAINAIEFGITHAKVFNKETGEVVELFRESNSELTRAADRIKALPSADVVEVIRCKDCKYGVRPVLAGQMKCNKDGERWVFFDGYCDLAERQTAKMEG